MGCSFSQIIDSGSIDYPGFGPNRRRVEESLNGSLGFFNARLVSPFFFRAASPYPVPNSTSPPGERIFYIAPMILNKIKAIMLMINVASRDRFTNGQVWFDLIKAKTSATAIPSVCSMFVGYFAGITPLALTYNLDSNNSQLIQTAERGDIFRVRIICVQSLVVQQFDLSIHPAEQNNQVVRLPVEEIIKTPDAAMIKAYRPLTFPVGPQPPRNANFLLSTPLLGGSLSSINLSFTACYVPSQGSTSDTPFLRMCLLLVRGNSSMSSVTLLQEKIHSNDPKQINISITPSCGNANYQNLLKLTTANTYLVLSRMAFGGYGQIKITNFNMQVTSSQAECFRNPLRKQISASQYGYRAGGYASRPVNTKRKSFYQHL
jgi:hypothetical protein